MTLPKKLYSKVADKASSLGLGVATYMKHIAIEKIEEEMPVFQASRSSEKAILEGERDLKAGKLKVYDSVDEMLKELKT